MMKHTTTLAAGLAALLVGPSLLSQGQVKSLEEALAATERALEILRGLAGQEGADPLIARSLVLAATEPAPGDPAEGDRRLEALRSEIGLLQMELDARLAPVLAGDGSVQSALGARLPVELPAAPPPLAFPTAGLDDGLRAQLAVPQALPRGTRATTTTGPQRAASAAAEGTTDHYSADPLRHGIACYRAGRYAEARALLAPLDTAALW